MDRVSRRSGWSREFGRERYIGSSARSASGPLPVRSALVACPASGLSALQRFELWTLIGHRID